MRAMTLTSPCGQWRLPHRAGNDAWLHCAGNDAWLHCAGMGL